MKNWRIPKLVFGLRQRGGRITHGPITCPRRGALVKKLYRFLDTKRKISMNITGGIIIQHYLYRTGFISLVSTTNAIITYILAADYPSGQEKIYNLQEAPIKRKKNKNNFKIAFLFFSLFVGIFGRYPFQGFNPDLIWHRISHTQWCITVNGVPGRVFTLSEEAMRHMELDFLSSNQNDLFINNLFTVFTNPKKYDKDTLGLMAYAFENNYDYNYIKVFKQHNELAPSVQKVINAAKAHPIRAASGPFKWDVIGGTLSNVDTPISEAYFKPIYSNTYIAFAHISNGPLKAYTKNIARVRQELPLFNVDPLGRRPKGYQEYFEKEYQLARKQLKLAQKAKDVDEAANPVKYRFHHYDKKDNAFFVYTTNNLVEKKKIYFEQGDFRDFNILWHWTNLTPVLPENFAYAVPVASAVRQEFAKILPEQYKDLYTHNSSAQHKIHFDKKKNLLQNQVIQNLLMKEQLPCMMKILREILQKKLKQKA